MEHDGDSDDNENDYQSKQNNQYHNMSTYLLFDYSIQTYLQFKQRFSENETIISSNEQITSLCSGNSSKSNVLSRIELFLNEFLLNSINIQTNINDKCKLRSYLESKKDLNSIFIELINKQTINTSDSTDLFQIIQLLPANEEFVELRVKNMLCVLNQLLTNKYDTGENSMKNLLSVFEKYEEKIKEILFDRFLVIFKSSNMNYIENRQLNCLKLTLNNEYIYKLSFKSKTLSDFIIELAKLCQYDANANKNIHLFDRYINSYFQLISDNNQSNNILTDQGLELLLNINNLNLDVFKRLIDKHEIIGVNDTYIKIMFKNDNHIFDANNLPLFQMCFNIIISYISDNSDQFDVKNNDYKHKLDEFLLKTFEYKPYLCCYLIKNQLNHNRKHQKKFLELLKIHFNKSSELIENLFDSKLKQKNVSYKNGTLNGHNDGNINMDCTNNFNFYKNYNLTLSRADQNLLIQMHKLNEDDKKFNFLQYNNTFIENSIKNDVEMKQNDANNDEGKSKSYHLNIEVKISDLINDKLNDSLLEKSILNYPLERKLSDLLNHKQYINANGVDCSTLYDPIFLLPNLFYLLDYGKTDF